MFSDCEDDDLTADDGDGRKSFPQRREGVAIGGAAVVAEHGAGLLDSVHQTDQTLHARHLVKKKMMKVLRKHRGFRNPRVLQRVKEEGLERERNFEDKLVTDREECKKVKEGKAMK